MSGGSLRTVLIGIGGGLLAGMCAVMGVPACQSTSAKIPPDPVGILSPSPSPSPSFNPVLSRPAPPPPDPEFITRKNERTGARTSSEVSNVPGETVTTPGRPGNTLGTGPRPIIGPKDGGE